MSDAPWNVSSRRGLMKGLLGLALSSQAKPVLAAPGPVRPLIAQPPAGFSPLNLPGIVSKAESKGDFVSMMRPNLLWPKAEVAARLLETALTELTHKPNLQESLACFFHPEDVIAIKVNGISGQNGATAAVNFELIFPVVQGLLKLGVPAEHITVYEQFPTYLKGTRVNVKEFQLPAGVNTGTHNNIDHVMAPINVFEKIPTRYCRFFTEATAVLDMTMMKDHSICGFTGAMKNITHGNIDNPDKHHAFQGNPQIPLLYAHPIVQSRVRLHLVDAFKIIIDRGPLDRDPNMRVGHGAVYASTDPVALDTVGYRVIDQLRKEKALPPLAEVGRAPRYLEKAAELGLGLMRDADLRLRQRVV